MAPDPHAHEAAATAARWVARREAGLTAAEKAELQAWLRAEPRHAAAFAAADPNASELDWPLHTGALDRVLAGLAARAAQRRARRNRLVRSGAVAGVVAAVALFSSRWLPHGGEAPAPATAHSLVVRSPEVRTLPDGSVVELKGDADLRVAFSADARRIELVRGAAHFTVRKDAARPFLVTAGGVTARAVGTAFLVGLETGQVALVVTEGRVALDRAAAAVATAAPPQAAPETLAFVQAGESVAVDHAGLASPGAAPRVTALPAAEQQQRLAWRTPRLEFNGTPLREIVAAVNRHNRAQLVLGDAALGDLRLSGALSADRIDALLEMLEADFRVTAETAGDRLVLRRAIPRVR
jgi:transmembrane sensor